MSKLSVLRKYIFNLYFSLFSFCDDDELFEIKLDLLIIIFFICFLEGV